MSRASPSRAARRPGRTRSSSTPSPALPPVRVVVLNYNAGAYIGRCLESLQATRYPDFHIVVVDNASTDGSAELVQAEFPDVTLLRAGANLGFAGGNNLALRAAPTPFVALLNPDTTVDAGWLRPLAERLLADPIAGGVGPKIIFADDRLPLRLRAQTFRPGGVDPRELGVRVYAAVVHSATGRADVRFNRGVFGVERDAAGALFRWTGAEAELAAPLADGSTRLVLEVAAGTGRRGVSLSVVAGDSMLVEVELGPGRRRVELALDVDAAARMARPVIENAGIKPLRDGSMRDRGTRIAHGNVWHDWDGLGYRDPREVFAVKGGAALYRADMLTALGLFDAGIFLYYEDADLCWRARRRGWRFWYEPAGVVRHAHAALSGEWSPTFIRHVEFGKLRMLAKNAPLRWAAGHAGANARFAVAAAQRGMRALARGPAARRSAAEFRARLGALLRTLAMTPDTARLRARERQLAPLDGREIEPFIETT